jgi:hypothetical protein
MRIVKLIGGPANGASIEIDEDKHIIRIGKIPEIPTAFDSLGEPGHLGVNPFPEEYEYRQSYSDITVFNYVPNA